MSIQQTMIFVWGLALVALTLAAALQYQSNMPTPTIDHARTEVQIGKTTIEALVADTPELQVHGLSGRESLAEGEGMLFIFEEEGAPGIWMKDMLFPIDILWADSEGTIITIASNVAPDTYPQSFYPTAPRAKYVLEVPAGFAERQGIAEGMKIVVQ